MRRTFLHRIVLSAFVFLFVNLNSFSQTGTITGRVKYGKEMLQGATVSLGSKVTLTDRKGEFSFSVKAGHYTLAITHAGYNRMEKEVTVSAGANKNFDFDMVPNEQLGEVVTLGSRALIQRSNLNTPVPVDAFSSAQLLETGQTSLMQMLNYTAPSLNASMQNAYEPVTLRGLYPDQILVTVNGTRYNNTAYINNALPRGQLGRGGVGNDLNSIPFSAIEKIEILRDGASAQYGSDAVAGVIDIKLKESTDDKTSISLHVGQQYKGDGENIKFGIFHGNTINKRGFLNYSADFRLRNPTFRGGEYQGLVYKNYTANTDSMTVRLLDDSMVKARGFDRTQASNAGNAKLNSFGILTNGGYPISSNAKIFWTGAINNSSFTFVFPYFYPNMNAQVNTELFPNGFMGRMAPDIWNTSGILGAKGQIGREKEIHWEYSSAYGRNSARYNSENTNNASQQFSLGKNAPTKFYTGTFIYQQLTNTIHFTKNILEHGNTLKSMNIAFGGELRFEGYSTKPGEEASWKSYDLTGRKNGGSQTSLTVSPDNVVSKSRSVACSYIDLETDFKNELLLDLAGRFEHYSDFGSNLAGKIAVRYKLTDKTFVRGSVGNGFRAPSMQQRYWSAINYGFIRGGGVSTPTTAGVFNNESEVAKVFGVATLEAEKSLNLGAGVTSAISRHIYLTIDAYWIQIKNRVVLSGVFDRTTNDEVDSLLRNSSLSGLGLGNVTRVSFFSNAINTKTQGVDAVLHGKWNFHKSQLIAVFSANFTRISLFGKIKTAANLSASDSNKNTLFGEEQRANLENAQPRSKIILTLNYKVGKVGFILRNTRFGKTGFDHYNSKNNPPPEAFAPKILTDFACAYSPKPWLTLTGGANNIFDVYPDRIKNFENTNGGLYTYAMESSPFGNSGGYYYVSMSFNF
jgi:iron complex outermembrane recepter protein